jgi:Double zinc ribbon
MRCSACGSESAPSARFCSDCGRPLAPPPEPPPPPAPPPPLPHPQAPPTALQVNVHLAHHGLPAPIQRGVYCVSCQQRTVPVPYFSRGINIAKLAVLLPFTFVGPLLFFLIRKDRLVCSWCRALLPGELPLPLLDAFESAPSSMNDRRMVPYGSEGLMPSDLVGHEIAHLERRSRRNRRRSWSLGLAAAMMTVLGGMAASAGAEPTAFFFAMGGLSGAGALVSSQRGKRFGAEAASKRHRQRVLEVLGLARAHHGRINVTMVASHMSLDLPEAESLLDSMVDGRRVDVHVDEQGRMTYVFPELLP